MRALPDALGVSPEASSSTGGSLHIPERASTAPPRASTRARSEAWYRPRRPPDATPDLPRGSRRAHQGHGAAHTPRSKVQRREDQAVVRGHQRRFGRDRGLASPRQPLHSKARTAAARWRGSPESSKGAVARSLARGKLCESVPAASGRVAPYRRANLPARVAAARTEICCPMIALTASSNAFVVPGMRIPLQRTADGPTLAAVSRKDASAGSAVASTNDDAASIKGSMGPGKASLPVTRMCPSDEALARSTSSNPPPSSSCRVRR